MTECARHEGHVYNLCTSASLCSIIISVYIYLYVFLCYSELRLVSSCAHDKLSAAV